MYDDFYKLNKRPFQLNADTDFYFDSGTHQKAMVYMRYGLTQGEGFIVITGKPGTGKTLLVKQLVGMLKKSKVVLAVIVSSQLNAEDLLKTISSTFKLNFKGLDKASLLAGLERFFIEQAMHGKKALLVVDEAQNLSHEALEELRMLSNFEMAGKPLFQTFLVGQNQLLEKLFLPEMEQLKQRIVATCQIKPFDEQETKDYIIFRLAKAGWKQNPKFGEDAFPLIAHYSQGIPRKINTLCDRILLFGYISELPVVDAGVVQQVIADIEEERFLEDDGGGQANWSGSLPVNGGNLEQRIFVLEKMLADIHEVLGRAKIKIS